MKLPAAAENGFRFKGVWWTEATFTNILQTVLAMHRTVNNHRVAFHFGVSEKAVRKLRARSSIANVVMLRLMEAGKSSEDRPARYRERGWYNNHPDDVEVRKILIAAEAERDRQHEVRHTLRKQRARPVAGGVAQRMRVERHDAVQRCKRSGLTQVLTADSLSCSLSTVRRYW